MRPLPEYTFGKAIDAAITDAMAGDERIVLIGEDVPMLRAALFARFGADRVMAAPISESAFLGAAAGAAMGGLRPVVELYMVDFLAVGFDAVLNHMAKMTAFTAGTWPCPVLIRAPSGGWYGDGGQHGQSLWGILAAIPGLTVVVPSTPADAYGLTRTALTHDGPVILFEPKLLSAEWLEFLGSGGRTTVTYDVPTAGATGEVPRGHTVPFGQARVCKAGDDLTIVSVAVGVHRALEAAVRLAGEGITCEVVDLRSLRPLDRDAIVASVHKTNRLLVVDEDYCAFGLSGEMGAVVLEAGLAPQYARVCLENTLPYARDLEDEALPNVDRIIATARRLVAGPHGSS
jgi:pyruvate dehydrogenase E1 component beta subunit